MFNVSLIFSVFGFLQYAFFTIMAVLVKRYISTKYLAFYFAASCGLLTLSLLLLTVQNYLHA